MMHFLIFVFICSFFLSKFKMIKNFKIQNNYHFHLEKFILKKIQIPFLKSTFYISFRLYKPKI